MTDVADTRANLVSAIEGSAQWRGRKAEEYPDDDRNKASQMALQVAARDVAVLPLDDPRLVHHGELG